MDCSRHTHSNFSANAGPHALTIESMAAWTPGRWSFMLTSVPYIEDLGTYQSRWRVSKLTQNEDAAFFTNGSRTTREFRVNRKVISIIGFGW